MKAPRAPMLRPTSEMTTLNRKQLREIGLTSGGVRELFEAAFIEAVEKGCNCGIERIVPTPKDRRRKHYHVQVIHAKTCPLSGAVVAKRHGRLGSLFARLRRR